MKFENSETLQCLINAFAGESQARNKYSMYATIAKKEGYKLISEVFLETAENEKEQNEPRDDQSPDQETLLIPLLSAIRFPYGHTP